MEFPNHQYQAALEGVAFYSHPAAGYLRIAGADRAAFIQRQTSNDIRLLAPDRAVLSVLTSPTARILDVLYFVDEGNEGQIGAVTLPGRGAATFRFLKSRIFFNDQVAVTDLSPTTAQIDLMGPGAGEVLRQLGLSGEIPLHGVQKAPIHGFDARVVHTSPSFILGSRLLLPVEAMPTLEASLEAAGAARLDPQVYELLRIEAGIPGPGGELTEAFTPLETGLESAVSDKKGCYTGQEILARQVTYDKVTQKLRGLLLTGEAAPGDRVWAEGKPAGEITSAALSPRLGWIALAVLKRSFLEPGLPVAAGRTSEAAQPAVVSSLPFVLPETHES
jgi:tRNA-modifying protein YgfZ